MSASNQKLHLFVYSDSDKKLPHKLIRSIAKIYDLKDENVHCKEFSNTSDLLDEMISVGAPHLIIHNTPQDEKKIHQLITAIHNIENSCLQILISNDDNFSAANTTFWFDFGLHAVLPENYHSKIDDALKDLLDERILNHRLRKAHVPCLLQCELVQSDLTTLTAFIKNISEFGCFITPALPNISSGDFIRVRLHFFDTTVTANGRVVWVRKRPTDMLEEGFGVEFANLNSALEKDIRNFIKQVSTPNWT